MLQLLNHQATGIRFRQHVCLWDLYNRITMMGSQIDQEKVMIQENNFWAKYLFLRR